MDSFYYSFGTKGFGPIELNNPVGIVTDDNNQMYITEDCKCYISIFNTDGQFV